MPSWAAGWTELGDVPPETIWGLVSRGIALVYVISFASLVPQVLPIAGRAGVTPVADTLEATARHFPTWKRFLYFPTLLWLSKSDAFLRALPWVGLIAASAAVFGGPFSPAAFAVCYVAYLSLDRAVFLVYPWDSVLFEAGFWAIFLPATLPLPDVATIAAPLPSVAWVYRLLVFRVMLGFGKHKFIGSTKQDKGFLKPFFVNQPLPTAPGLLATRLPLWFHQLSLLVMFVAEVPMPFTVFFPGAPSVVGGVSTIALMFGIWLTGSYGYFNVAVIVLSLTWFDTATARAFHVSAAEPSRLSWWIDVLAVSHTGLALLAFPFNTFCSHTWMNWPFWRRFGPLGWPFALARWVHPFRIVHAYGVFPPRTPPPMKLSPVLEGTWDGQEWHAYSYRFYPTSERSRPKLCAPHHARFDQALVYEPLGINEASILRTIVGRWEPYGHGGTPAGQRIMRRVLEGAWPASFFVHPPAEAGQGAPVSVRARLVMLEPASPGAENWWTASVVGPHFPPVKRGDPRLERPVPPPELWNLDDLVWLRRSTLGALMERSLRGEDAHALVCDGGELSPADTEAFWQRFLPEFGERRGDWSDMRDRVERTRAAYDAETLYRFERISSRYGALLYARLEPLFEDGGLAALFGKRASSLDVKSSFHLRLLALHVVGEGRDAYDAVMREPSSASRHLPAFTLATGYFFHALFRYEVMAYQSQKFRLLTAYTEFEGRPKPTGAQLEQKRRAEAFAYRFLGVVEAMEFLRTQFTSERDVQGTKEAWPRFELSPRGDVKRIASQP